MSRLSEYNKFDKLNDEDNDQPEAQGKSLVDAVTTPFFVQSITKKGSEDGRYIYECNGQIVYEWDQSLEGDEAWI
jgi:hypothetical protein